uniref:NAD-dependent epimerase/dehydratase family protein n=1 Tax=candidate division WOR-3 bacterium TaxID=2052148 RepID=A0A7C6A7X8_UNCW3
MPIDYLLSVVRYPLSVLLSRSRFTVTVHGYLMDKVLITGGAGFIGSNLATVLLNLGYEVVIIDNLSTGRRENVPPKAKFYEVDIVNPLVNGVVFKEKPKVIFHLAALTDTTISEDSIRKDIKVNLIGTLNILRGARAANVEKFIFTSTAAVYGNSSSLPIKETAKTCPISPYGIGKLTCENYIRIFCEAEGIKYTILRYSNVYGPRQYPKGESGAIPIFIQKVLKGETPTLFGNGKQIRDYIYVDDVVSATQKAIARADAKILNVSTSIGTSTEKLYKMVVQKLCLNPPKGEPRQRFKQSRPGEIKKSILANSLAKRQLGWQPKIDLSTGIEKTIEWWREQKW